MRYRDIVGKIQPTPTSNLYIIDFRAGQIRAFKIDLVRKQCQSKDTPVVMVTGPRQCGKTTLVRDLVAGKREFITMNDDTVLAAARSDPTGLVRALDRTTIDEVQRVPDLLRAIKKSVDDNRRAGAEPTKPAPPAAIAYRRRTVS